MVLALAFACVPALAAAQSAGPLAAPALSRYDAPPLWAMEVSARPDASLLPASMDAARAQDPLPKSRLYYSLPASAALGVAGFAGGYGTGMVLLGCEDSSGTCETGPDDAEYKLAALGLAIGSAAGAHYGGRRGESKGDWWLTLAAAAAGALPLVFGDAGDNAGLILASGGLSVGAAVVTDHFVRRPR